MQLQIIIAEPNRQARRALTDLLREQPDMKIVGVVADAKNLIDLARKQPVHVIILDYGLLAAATPELIPQLRKLKPSPKLVVMSSNPENARLALNSGADFFVSKGDQSEWLLETLHRCEIGLEGHQSA